MIAIIAIALCARRFAIAYQVLNRLLETVQGFRSRSADIPETIIERPAAQTNVEVPKIEEVEKEEKAEEVPLIPLSRNNTVSLIPTAPDAIG